uniref:Uncharacterized protein n=1 Tax=Hemiselmis tepida TaxID=464990 RepID=A0A7S0YUX4_9CRYP|mmetsp:Transcript_22489/g.56751  ORF Transcript_22489/g.56751 Transcript_22489/m.56751 type:complete len:165 (+) Transcript_22489:96-590(+)
MVHDSGLGGTGQLTSVALTRAADVRSLPTQVHVKPSSINCNNLRSEADVTKYSPSVLIGNWDEQRQFDAAHTVNPEMKPKGFIYHKTHKVYHDRICPPTLGGVQPRYVTENRSMSDWLPSAQDKLPDINDIRDSMGRPMYADADMDMYQTTADLIGSHTAVSFK